MNSAEFAGMLQKLRLHISEKKEFTVAHERKLEFDDALAAAEKLFPEAHIEVRDDPLQMGSLILHIEMADINIGGTESIRLFSKLIEKADNFEIYPMGTDGVCFALVFQSVMLRF